MKTPLPPRARVAANAMGIMAVLQVSELLHFDTYISSSVFFHS